MNKVFTYLRYFFDYIKHGEFRFLYYSMAYVVKGATPRKSRVYKSSLGKFYVRKGTLDFQFGNYAYEWEVKKFVYKYVDDYEVFLDIGANIGAYSILFAGKGLTGFAFEPVKSNLEALTKNIELNHIEDKVKIMPCALGSSKQIANFTFDPVNTGASHLTDDNIDAEIIVNPEFEDIQVNTLDNLVESLNIDHSKKILVKIDVEGMEIDVLRGAKRFIEQYPNLLIVMESIHSGKEKLTMELLSICDFEIFYVDELNMAARKK
ncbi:MAG: FkbM family methyltransferase [Bacteroidales bacterium]|nr:FkbM family methyltransferase [Bacteroidales bacterium]